MDSNDKKNPIFGLVKMKQGTSRKMMTNAMRRRKSHVKKTTIITPIPTTKTKQKNQLMNNTTSNKTMNVFNERTYFACISMLAWSWCKMLKKIIQELEKNNNLKITKAWIICLNKNLKAIYLRNMKKKNQQHIDVLEKWKH